MMLGSMVVCISDDAGFIYEYFISALPLETISMIRFAGSELKTSTGRRETGK